MPLIGEAGTTPALRISLLLALLHPQRRRPECKHVAQPLTISR
jgi:hypothetical protein